MFQGFTSFGFNEGFDRDLVLVFFSNLNTFLARVKSANDGDASLYDKHFVANIQSGLTPIMFRLWCHHSLRVLQLNNVPTFVNTLGNKFFCESSAIIVKIVGNGSPTGSVRKETSAVSATL